MGDPYDEHIHVRQLHVPAIDPHLLGVQLDRIAGLEGLVARNPSGAPRFTVLAPGALSVVFEDDPPELAELTPAVFQLRGHGDVVWTADARTPSWRLKELRWYAHELSLLDTDDIGHAVDACHPKRVAELARARRVTGPAPLRTEPRLVVVSKGVFRLTFPPEKGSPDWATRPVTVRLGDDITTDAHENTPPWRLAEIHEYVLVLKELHAEATADDPERAGTGMSPLRSPGVAPRRPVPAVTDVGAMLQGLSLGAPRRGSLSSPCSTSPPPLPAGLSRRATEPVGLSRRVSPSFPSFSGPCGMPGPSAWQPSFPSSPIYPGPDPSATSGLTSFNIFLQPTQPVVHVAPARVYLLPDSVALDMPHGTSEAARRFFIEAAVQLQLGIDSTGRVAQYSMPPSPNPRPEQEPTVSSLPPPAPASTRLLIEVHTQRERTAPAELPRFTFFPPPFNAYGQHPAPQDVVYDMSPIPPIETAKRATFGRLERRATAGQ